MKAPLSNSRRLISPRLENPVRGCLFIGKHAPSKLSLFVFRRRGFGRINAPDNPELDGQFWGFPNFAPPKNKKEMISWTIVSINRQPLTGFVRPTLLTVSSPSVAKGEALWSKDSFTRERHE
jgi:hypothetical protein